VVAIGLGGPEIGFPAAWYAPSFDRARAAGLHCVPHAGETGGAAYVAEALTALRAERIGHGVMCLDDGDVVKRLVDTGVPLEVSLTSNVLLGVAASYAEHPLPVLLERGLEVSLNTDDPGYFDTDLTKELACAHADHGLDLEALRRLQLGAVEASFLEPAAKAALRAEIEAYASPPPDGGDASRRQLSM
jgi:aminodeoxyfutalosine deaminase